MAPKPTAQQSKIEPPEGWKLHSEHGFMRCGAGHADRLVRLHDVVTWLMNSRELPLAAAVDAVCSALEKNGLDGVHYLNGDDYAYAHDAPSPWDRFVGKVDGAAFAKILKASWLISPYALESLVNTPGLPPNYDASKQTPFEYSNSPESHVAKRAITWSMANKHWGWGAVADVLPLQSVPLADKLPATWAELKRYHADNHGHAWTQAMRQIVAKEEARRNSAGHTGVRKAMAVELDMSPQGIGDHIRKAQSGTKSGRGRLAV